MLSNVMIRLARTIGLLALGLSVYLVAAFTPSPIRAAGSCPCFTIETIVSRCRNLGYRVYYNTGAFSPRPMTYIRCSPQKNGPRIYYELRKTPETGAICRTRDRLKTRSYVKREMRLRTAGQIQSCNRVLKVSRNFLKGEPGGIKRND